MIMEKTWRNPHRRNIIGNRKAASPAVSMVIITAATVVLVLVSSSFALQTIERQQAASEFDTAQKSILAFDDAVRDIAWDRGGSRTIRFTTRYGNLQLISGTKSFSITSSLGLSESFTTGVLKYNMPTGYFTLGSEYSPSYILGDTNSAVSRIDESVGQALVSQESGFATVSLNYRVRVSNERPSTYIISDSVTMNYVDLLVIHLNCDNSTIGTGDFDLVAKNVGLDTVFLGKFEVPQSGDYTLSITSDNLPSSTSDIHLYLDKGWVTFNQVNADVRVST